MKFSAKGACLTTAVVSLAGLVLLSACQTAGMRDRMGRGVQVTEWKTIDVSEVTFNLPLFISQEITKVEYQLRDNEFDHNRLQLEGGKGIVFTQHSDDAWFGHSTEQAAGDEEKFKEEAVAAFKIGTGDLGEVREIKRRGKRTKGFATVVHVKDPSKGSCYFSKVGYRMKGVTLYDNDTGNIDTFVEIVYCDPSVTIDSFSEALENADLVDDRAAFKAALAAK